MTPPSHRKSAAYHRDPRIVPMTLPRRERERLRRAFLPSPVQLLFVGESPPASGRFFYSSNSGLYRAMRDAFRTVYNSVDDENFLSVFQASGCYLTDLCSEPVDQLEMPERRATCSNGEVSLSQTIARLQPAMIASVLRSIERNVSQAASLANWHGPILNLPYPGRWSRHRRAFSEALAPTIRTLTFHGRARL